MESVKIFESALFRTNAVVIQTPDLVLVIDPNWLPIEITAIRNYVTVILANRPLYLLFTHSDYDHIIGYRAFGDATVIASQYFVQNPDKQSVIEQILAFDDEYYITRDYPIEYPSVDIVVEEDGQILQIGDTILSFYHAHGHNSDGIFTVIQPLGVCVMGDYCCNIEFPYIYQSSLEYEKTLAKFDPILARYPNLQWFIAGHGDAACSQADLLARRAEALDYISDLRRCIAKRTEFDVSQLWKKYKFPRLMTKFHEANVTLMKRENQSTSIKIGN